jgi:hypothetical protein
MTVTTKILDGRGSSKAVRVTNRGQLIVGNAAFSTAYNVELGAAATAGNIVGPQSGKNFIITDMLIYANRNVGVNDARVTIYESTDGPATSTETKVIYETDIAQQTSRDLLGLNLEVTEGMWVNAITDDDDVLITVMGYFINVN